MITIYFSSWLAFLCLLLSSVYSQAGMFSGATAFDQDLCASGWDKVRSDGVHVDNFCDGRAQCGDWTKCT